MADIQILDLGSGMRQRSAPLAEKLTATPTGTEPIDLSGNDVAKIVPLDLGLMPSSAKAPIVNTPIPTKKLAPAESDNSFSFVKPIISGSIGIGENVGSSFEMLGKLIGSKYLAEQGASLSNVAEEAGKPYQPRVGGIQDVKGAGDVPQLAYNMLAQNAPNMGFVAGAEAAGAATPIPLAAPVAGFVASYLLNAGDTYKEMKDAGYDEPAIAAAIGIPVALLDSLSMGSLMGNIGAKRVITSASKETGIALAKVLNAAMRVAKAGGTEAGTEIAQEMIQSSAVPMLSGKDYFTPENAVRWLNAGLGGFIGGAGFHGAGEAIHAIRPLHELERDTSTRPPTAEAPQGPFITNENSAEPIAANTDSTPALSTTEENLKSGIDILKLSQPDVTTTPEVASPAPEPAPLGREVASGPLTFQQEATVVGKDYSKSTAPSIGQEVANTIREYAPEQMLDALSNPSDELHQTAQDLSSAIEEMGVRKTSATVREKVVTRALEKSGMSAEEASQAYESYKPVLNVIAQRTAPNQGNVVVRFLGNDAGSTEQMVRDVLPGKHAIVEPPTDGRVVEKAQDGSYRIEAESRIEAANAIGGATLNEAYSSLSPEAQTTIRDAWKVEGAKDQTFSQYLATRPEMSRALQTAYTISKPSLPYDQWIARSGELARAVPAGRDVAASAHTPAEAKLDDESNALIDKAVLAANKEFKDAANKFQADRDKWVEWHHITSGILRFAQAFPHVKGVQDYLDLNQDFGALRNRVLFRIDGRKKQIDMLGLQRKEKLSKFIFDKDALSDKKGAKLSPQELRQLVLKHGLDKQTEAVAEAMEADMTWILNMSEQAALEDASRRWKNDPVHFAKEEATIKEEFRTMRDVRNYFPHTRFGKHVAIVKARSDVNYAGKKYKAGDTVYMQTFDFALNRDRALPALEQTFHKSKFNVAKDTLVEGQAQFMGVPPSLFRALETELNLTDSQKLQLRQYMAEMAPGSSARKHFLKREGIAGFSRDTVRVYSDYMTHMAGLIARTKYYRPMSEAVNSVAKQASEITEGGPDATGRRAIYAHLLQHYNGLMNPVSELAGIKSAMFYATFWFRPKHWIQNFSNMIAAHNEISARKAPGVLNVINPDVTKQFVRSFQDVLKPDHLKLSGDELAAVNRGIEEGVLAQSYAQNAAEAGRGGLPRLLSSHPIGNVFENLAHLGMRPFAWSEEYARRAAFLTAWRMNPELEPEARFKEARDVVQKVFNEFSAWNRPNLLSGSVSFKKRQAGLFTVMQSWQFNMLKHIWNDAGGRRTLATTIAMAGLMGAPFADDADKILGALITWIRKEMGVKDPHFSPSDELAKIIHEYVMSDPSYILHGAGSNSFGMSAFFNMFGMPFPNFDVSSSLSMGRAVPMAVPSILQHLVEGKKASDIMDAVARDAKDASGALVSMGISAWEALLGHDLYKAADMLAAWRDIHRAYQAANTGAYVDSKGEPVLPLNFSDPQETADWLGLALGLAPHKLEAKREGDSAFYEKHNYYLQWREEVINDFVKSVVAKDAASKSDALDNVRKYNASVQPPYKIAPDELRRSSEARMKNRRLREMGLPSVKRYTQVYRDAHGAYQPSPND